MQKKEKLSYFLKLYIPIFCLFSSISIYSASMYLSPTLGNLVLKQCSWYLIGIIFIYGIYKLENSSIYRYSWYLYFINILLLLGLIIFGDEINGSRSWYTIRGFGSLQPSEFMKIGLILMNAITIDYFMTNKSTIKEEAKMIFILFLLLMIPSILCFLQPDTGSVIILFVITASMLFVSGIRKEWFYLFFIILISFFGGFFYLYFFKSNLFVEFFGSNFFYRIDRILNWSNNSGMQLNNSLIAIGSSGIIGHGFNQTPLYFPEAGTDFIFTVFSSNFGLIGTMILLLLFLIFDLSLINRCRNCKKKKNKYVLAGIIGILLYQQFQNIGMTIGLIPITGITLPFISYGGSSLLSYLILLGIVANIEKNEKQKNKKFS